MFKALLMAVLATAQKSQSESTDKDDKKNKSDEVTSIDNGVCDPGCVEESFYHDSLHTADENWRNVMDRVRDQLTTKLKSCTVQVSALQNMSNDLKNCNGDRDADMLIENLENELAVWKDKYKTLEQDFIRQVDINSDLKDEVDWHQDSQNLFEEAFNDFLGDAQDIFARNVTDLIGLPDLENLTESVTNFTDGTFGNITFDGTFSNLTESLNVTELLHNTTELVNKTELLMEAAGNATEFLANTTSKIEELMPNMTDALIDLES